MTRNNFDVLLPVYKGDKLDVFVSAVESILNNSLTPARLIIVKDGPLRMNVADYLNQLDRLHSFIFLCDLHENRGLAQALNIGLKHCESELVFRCDADDINHPQRFELQLREMEKSPCDVLGCQITEVDPLSGTEKIKKVPISSHDLIKFSEYRNPINHMTVLFRRSVITSVGGYPDIRFKEDYALWLKLLHSGYTVRNSDLNVVRARAGVSMINRRRGFSSLKSEIDLFRFRLTECRQFNLRMCFYFFVRSASMILPRSLLIRTYSMLRSSNDKL